MTRRPPGVWSAAWLLARKDLRQYFRDKVGMALGFLLPLALVSIFGFIMGHTGGGGGAMPRVELAVVDLDRSAESSRLVEARRQWERGQGRDWKPAPSYFPEYRS